MNQHTWMAVLSVLAVTAAAGTAHAAIVDGFGDGDRDNDGSLEGPLTDPGDVGIEWYSIGGTTSGGNLKPEPSIADDAAGLGSGNALFVQARGSNAEMAGFFGQKLSLGSNLGDTMTVSFDVRLNATSEPLADLSNSAEFRFGLYSSDQPIGTGGFGTSDGDFDGGSNPGVGDDSGFMFRTPIGDAEPAGVKSRIVYEPDNPDNILGGSGTETIKDEEGFGGMYDELKHTFSVEFERIAGAPGEDILITWMIDGNTLSDTTVGEGLPASTDLVSFDYFAAITTGDMDWVIDNFSINLVPAPGAAAVLGAAGFAAGIRRRR
ncbi:MAG: hypothetical protein AAFX05_07920 [Planctomycetota bacterium]